MADADQPRDNNLDWPLIWLLIFLAIFIGFGIATILFANIDSSAPTKFLFERHPASEFLILIGPLIGSGIAAFVAWWASERSAKRTADNIRIIEEDSRRRDAKSLALMLSAEMAHVVDRLSEFLSSLPDDNRSSTHTKNFKHLYEDCVIYRAASFRIGELDGYLGSDEHISDWVVSFYERLINIQREAIGTGTLTVANAQAAIIDASICLYRIGAEFGLGSHTITVAERYNEYINEQHIINLSPKYRSQAKRETVLNMTGIEL